MAEQRKPRRRAVATSWESGADWYTGWVGEEGGRHHRKLTIPAVMDLLAPQPGEAFLDVGAGPGVLAPFIAEAGARYTGLDASQTMLRFARKHHGRHGRFLWGDACRLADVPGLRPAAFDGAVFLLSIQDMDPLQSVLESVAWALRGGGRLVIIMTHPCFRVPRLSGWGWDAQRQLQYRRVDRYLTPLPVPVETVGNAEGTATKRFHRPLHTYINALGDCGFAVDCMQEIATYKEGRPGPHAKAEDLATQEIPVFLGLRAWKVEGD
jgi:SAM-dependent methyltransferase